MFKNLTFEDDYGESTGNFATNFSHSSAVSVNARPHSHGKFIFVGDEKFYLRGVTYGTFAPDKENLSECNPQKCASDFAFMKGNGVNTVRVYTVPPP